MHIFQTQTLRSLFKQSNMHASTRSFTKLRSIACRCIGKLRSIAVGLNIRLNLLDIMTAVPYEITFCSQRIPVVPVRKPSQMPSWSPRRRCQLATASEFLAIANVRRFL